MTIEASKRRRGHCLCALVALIGPTAPPAGSYRTALPIVARALMRTWHTWSGANFQLSHSALH